MRVLHGIVDALAPEPSAPVAHPPRLSEECKEFRLFQPRDERPWTIYCEKRDGHDDPFAEIGGRQTDPTHAFTCEEDGVTITYAWRSDRV